MEERKKIFERESKFRKERQQNIEGGKKEEKKGRKTCRIRKHTWYSVCTHCTVNIEQEQHRFKSDILYNKMKVFIFDRNKCENKALPVH